MTLKTTRIWSFCDVWTFYVTPNCISDFTLELQIYIDISLLYIWLTSLKEIQAQFLSPKIICTCTTIFLKFYNKCDNKNESGHHSSSCFIYFLSSYFTLTSKGQLLKSHLGHNWHAKMTMSSIFLICIYSTRTITRRRSQGFAPGLSLWIILTLLSMCGAKISQGMTPARNHLTSIL